MNVNLLSFWASWCRSWFWSTSFFTAVWVVSGIISSVPAKDYFYSFVNSSNCPEEKILPKFVSKTFPVAEYLVDLEELEINGRSINKLWERTCEKLNGDQLYNA